ncbi:hypothetical protein Tco_1094177 [Tanacetum coccineum]|uniref:Uncharacterized protein n=1 Tax=Tanacetum coccineum TaxID=301880 RepID=A0ABQ5IG63_9ASTR
MLNKDNYIPWSSRLLGYAKSKPNRKLLENSILHGSYVRRMIFELGDPYRIPHVAEDFHLQTNYELTDKEAKQVKADNQAIHIILMGLPEDIYDVVDNYNTTQEKEAGFQLQAGEFDLMVAAAKNEEIEEVNVNCFLMSNLQQASTSSTHANKAPVYDSNGQNDSNVIPVDSSMDPSGGIVKQHPATIEETRAFYKSLYNNLVIEIYKIFKVEIIAIGNQVDERVIHFEKEFLKEADKFVRDFKSLEEEADESLAMIKVLEKENERLLIAVVSQNIMSIVQKIFVENTSNLQTKLERTKEKFETCIIKKKNEYNVFWNNWYKKCEECKYDKISYDKAYNDMLHQIERLQAQLGDFKGKSMNTQCASNSFDSLSKKLNDENVSLEFQVFSLEIESEYLKSIYKNLFDYIKQTRAQTKIKTDSLQEKLNDTIYENATLRAKLYTKFSKQKDEMEGTSANTKFAKPSILGKPPL